MCGNAIVKGVAESQDGTESLEADFKRRVARARVMTLVISRIRRCGIAMHRAIQTSTDIAKIAAAYGFLPVDSFSFPSRHASAHATLPLPLLGGPYSLLSTRKE